MREQRGHSPPREGWVKSPDGQIGATAATPPHYSLAPLTPPLFSELQPFPGPRELCPDLGRVAVQRRQRPRHRQRADSSFTAPVAPHRAPPRRSVLQHLIPCHGRDVANTVQGEGTRARGRLLCVRQGSLHRLCCFTTISCKLLN